MFKTQVIKRLLLIFLPLVLLTTGLTAIFHNSDVNHNQDLLKAEIKNDLDHLLEIGQGEFQLVVSDLLVLSEYHELQRHLENPDTAWMEALGLEYLSFSSKKRLYDQIRYLDETGQEIIRVNFNAGNPAVVPSDQLQNKADRYYFADAYALNKGEIFISPLDLNIEHGEIEEPLKPMIRFGTPVFNASGERRGIVLVNYLADNLLQKLGVTLSGRNPIVLLNPDGYWLQGPKYEDMWGFMYPGKTDRTFKNDFPETWEIINSEDSGQFVDENGLFTFSTIYPLLEGQKSSTGAGMASEPSMGQVEAEDYYWKLVYTMPPDAYALATGVNPGRYALIFGIIIASLAAISWFLSYLFVTMGETKRRYVSELEYRVVERTRELEEATQKAELASHSKSVFMGNMSHELKTPLTGIIGYTDVLIQQYFGELNEKQSGYTDRILEGAQHLLSKLDDILDIANYNSDTVELELSKVHVMDVIDSSLAAIRGKADSRDIKLTLEMEKDVENLELMADDGKFRHILSNLLSNALEFTPDGGSIKLTGKLAEGNLKVAVADTGIGLSADNRDKVFEEFFQVEGDLKDKTAGIGLGLTIAKKYVVLHGGRIWVESEGEGHGCTFHFTLPVSDTTDS